MIDLNNNSIFIGHIKQLLKNFNLPNCLVGEENATLGNHYIANNSIYFYDPDTNMKKVICPYIFGKEYRGLTTNLQIRNLIYDNYTHRYLGNYLRFLRDYKGIDLMSMYNCFDEEVNEREIVFNLSNDNNHKKVFEGIKDGFVTYSIPVRLNQLYTLNMQAHTALETCLTFYKIESWTKFSEGSGTSKKSYSIPTIINSLGKVSYKKYLPNSRILINPFQWTKNASTDPLGDDLPSPKYLADLIKTYNYELRLLIKLPVQINSPVTLLEGDYTATFNLNEKMPSYFRYKENNEDKVHGPIPGTFVYNPQLFDMLGTKNYLLSDRLEEYLVGNPISKLSEDYDILKVQKYLTSVQCECYSDKDMGDHPHSYLKTDSFGSWSEKDTETIKSYFIMNNDTKLGMNNPDLIGYVDKVVEEIMVKRDNGDYLV